jgi:hypothetical protein
MEQPHPIYTSKVSNAGTTQSIQQVAGAIAQSWAGDSPHYPLKISKNSVSVGLWCSLSALGTIFAP